MNLGRCRYKAVSSGGLPDKLLDDALNDLQKAAELEPKRAETYYWRGQTYFWRTAHSPRDSSEKSYKQALSEFENCLNADNTNYPAMISKAQCCVALEKWADADGAFEAAYNSARATDQATSLDYLAQWAQSIPTTAAGDRLKTLKTAKDRVFADAPKDFAEPLIFAGVIAQAENLWDEATAQYAAALTKPTAGGNRDYSAFLHMRSSEAGYSQLVALHGQSDGAAKAREQAEKTGAAMIQHADTAAELAKSQNSPTAQAAATYQAGLSRWTVGEYTEKRELKEAALPKFREAIQLAPRHKNSGLWRLVYVVHWDQLSNLSQKEPAALREAIRLLDEATHMSLPKDAADRTKAKLKEMNDRLPKK